MKQATGELNMTVVVVIAVGVLAAFFYTTIWPTIKNSYIASNKCSDAICDPRSVSDGMATCIYYKNGRQQGNSFRCVWKGKLRK